MRARILDRCANGVLACGQIWLSRWGLSAAVPANFNLIELRQLVGYLEPRRFDIDINVFVGPKLRIIVESASRNFN